MTIGKIIKNYREEKNLSQRQFAKKCKISNGYIAMLERGGINPKTKKPIELTIRVLSKIAEGLEVSLIRLIEMMEK